MDKDRLTDLPDDILCQILSLLPTKQAATTSVLSTRWRYTWASVFNVDFDDRDSRKHPSGAAVDLMFANFMDRFLKLRGVQSVKRFRLTLDGQYDSSRINTWISAAIAGKVEDLRLSINPPIPLLFGKIFLPRCCVNLVVLKLDGAIRFHVNRTTTSISFPRLKVLHLKVLDSWDNTSEAIEMLVSGCPVLDKLKIYMAECDSSQSLHVRSLSLRILKLYLYCAVDGYKKGLSTRQLNIQTPNLEYLFVLDEASEELYMVKPSSLGYAAVGLDYQTDFNKTWAEYAYTVVELLRNISGVKYFGLSVGTLEALRHQFLLVDKLISFENTTWLKLEASPNQWCFLIEMLEMFPNLEVFIANRSPHPGKLVWCAPRSVPRCLLASLKEIDLVRFKGELGEIDMVEYLVKNSVVLEEMAIKFESCITNKEEVAEKIQMFQRFPERTSGCEIVFSFSVHP